MAYVHRMITKDEDLIGIARLHWIYILKGVGWFFGLAAAGWIFQTLMMRGMMALARTGGSAYVPDMVLTMSNGLMLFMLVTGFSIFAFHVIMVIANSVSLTSRRVIHKRGLIFVKVEQIDIEEIRGDNLDLGYLGRFLGYGYIELDCRFIGDIKLPALERPERFLRALSQTRMKAQDTISMVVGKGNRAAAVEMVGADDDERHPEVKPPKPEPETQPGKQPDETPPLPNRPIPQEPPPKAETAEQKTDEKPMSEKELIAEIVHDAVPEITREVIQELKAQGLTRKPAKASAPPLSPDNDMAVDNALIHVFDDARHSSAQEDSDHDMRNKMEHSIH